MPEKTRDSIYAEPIRSIKGFEFDQAVAQVFEDMIQRSVPGYKTIIGQIGLLAEKFAQPASNCYDLGCSLGAASISMAESISKHTHLNDCQIIAMDNSTAMIAKAKTLLEKTSHQERIQLQHKDIETANFENASVMAMNFTLQFIAIEKREAIVDKIFQSLLPGGLLILSEKITFEDTQLQSLNTELHHGFKQANDYSELEIAQKRAALDNTLLPETITSHKNRLLSAGFSSAEVWFQCFNFISMLVVK